MAFYKSIRFYLILICFVAVTSGLFYFSTLNSNLSVLETKLIKAKEILSQVSEWELDKIATQLGDDTIKDPETFLGYSTEARRQFAERSNILANLTAVVLFVVVLGGLALMAALQLYRAIDKLKSSKSVTFTFSEVLVYHMEHYFSSNTMSKPTILLIMTSVLVFSGGSLLCLVANDHSFAESLWLGWLLVADHSAQGEYTEALERVIGLIMTVLGMLLSGFLVGIVTDWVGERTAQLKEGKSRVVEIGHVLILGWSDKVIPIIEELCIANESEGGGTIVVMSEKTKEEMEIAILKAEINYLGTQVVCRTGVATHAVDLVWCSAPSAKGIVVLAEPSLTANESDALALRVVLTLVHLKELRGHVVVEMCDVDNRELVKLVGQKVVETVVAHDIIGRLMVQSARQPGLAQVLERLLGFEGSEFYMKHWPDLVGVTLEEIVYRFPDACVLGIKHTNPDDGEVHIFLNPDGSFVYTEHDEILVLAEDDDTYFPTDTNPLWKQYRAHARDRLPKGKSRSPLPENVLFVGWRRDIRDMILELDHYVAPGSCLTIFCPLSVEERIRELMDDGLDFKAIQNLTLQHSVGSPISRRHLEDLKLEDFDSVLILADGNSVNDDVSKMDARSLTTLLLIRDVQASRDKENQAKAKVLDFRTEKHNRGKKKRPERKRRSSLVNQEESALWEQSLVESGDVAEQNLKPANEWYEYLQDQVERASSAGGMAMTMTDAQLEMLRRAKSEEVKKKTHTIISEILDSHTKVLIQARDDNDYVASNELVSRAIAMVCECREISLLLDELLSAVGNETYLRPVSQFLGRKETELSFWRMTARCRLKGEILIGYRIIRDGEVELRLNPNAKNMPPNADGSPWSRETPMTWHKEVDSLVTFATE